MKRTIVLLAILLMAAGCSADSTIDAAAVDQAVDDATDQNDDSDNDDSQNDAPTAAPDPTEPPAPTTAPAPTEAPETDNPPPDLLGSDDWCSAAQQVEDSFDGLELVNFSDPEALEEAYRTAGVLIAQAQLIAPPEIAADVATTVEGFMVLTNELEAVGWSFLDLDISALDGLDADMEMASFNIERYNFEVCGIDNGFDPADDPALRPDTEDDLTDDVPDGSIRDQVTAGFIQAGFTPEEAECLLEKLDLSNTEALADPSTLLPIFTECGISLERLAQLGG